MSIICDYCGSELDRNVFCCNSHKVMYYRKQGRHLPIPAKFRWEVFKRDNFTCKKCGLRDNLKIDHIIPQRRGGKTEMDNLQTLCDHCNKVKGQTIEKPLAPPNPIPQESVLQLHEQKEYSVCQHGAMKGLCRYGCK